MFEVTIKLTYEEFRKYIYAVIAAKRSSETKAFRRERVIMLSLTFTALAVFTGFLIYTYAETGDSFFLGRSLRWELLPYTVCTGSSISP